jgi:hypothetical protein
MDRTERRSRGATVLGFSGGVERCGAEAIAGHRHIISGEVVRALSADKQWHLASKQV